MSQVLAILATVFLTISVMFGLGEHLTDLVEKDPGLINKNQFYQWIFTTFAIVAITLGKMAIITFILQIEEQRRLGKGNGYYIFLPPVASWSTSSFFPSSGFDVLQPPRCGMSLFRGIAMDVSGTSCMAISKEVRATHPWFDNEM
jgi:hypothetical protein